MRLGIYVDDSLATGPSESELRQEAATLLSVFPGKIIESETIQREGREW